MVTLLSLLAMVAFATLLAAAMARFRKLSLRLVIGDAWAALLGALFSVVAATLVLTMFDGRSLASTLFLCGLLTTTFALHRRGSGSVVRALMAATAVSVFVILWLTLSLRGPGGGWMLVEAIAVVGLASMGLASGACAGWWSKKAKP